MSETTRPIINALNAPFWAAAAEGRLELPHCRDSGRAFWPPSPISPFTGSGMAWRACDASGTLRSIVTYRRVFQAAFAARLPYAVGLVELDAGPRLLVHIADPDAPDALRVDDRVRIDFVDLFGDGVAVPVLAGDDDRSSRLAL